MNTEAELPEGSLRKGTNLALKKVFIKTNTSWNASSLALPSFQPLPMTSLHIQGDRCSRRAFEGGIAGEFSSDLNVQHFILLNV